MNAIVQMIQIVFKLIEVGGGISLKYIISWFILQSTFKESQNPVGSFLFKACQVCLACIESFVQYLGKNAYIIITMDGSSFCTAGKRAFHILSTNSLRVLAINSVGDFVLLLGKVFVVVATVLIGIEMIQVTLELMQQWICGNRTTLLSNAPSHVSMQPICTKIRSVFVNRWLNDLMNTFLCRQNKPGLHYTSVPVVICGVFAFLVCHCFLTVYEMTIDTIFLCFCEDCERNDGIERPYYMSRGLMEFVQNSKQSLEKQSSKGKKNAWAGDGNVETIA